MELCRHGVSFPVSPKQVRADKSIVAICLQSDSELIAWCEAR